MSDQTNLKLQFQKYSTLVSIFGAFVVTSTQNHWIFKFDSMLLSSLNIWHQNKTKFEVSFYFDVESIKETDLL